MIVKERDPALRMVSRRYCAPVSAPVTPLGTDRIVTYLRPPVAEVVASVRFDDMSYPSYFSLGSLWAASFRDQFPNLEPKAPYDVPDESFAPRSSPAQLAMQFATVPPLPRLWLTDPSGDELVQLQRGWFATNWRRVQPTSEYDRWSKRRAAFDKHWQTLTAWLMERQDAPRPTQCEVTYINHIYTDAGLWESHDQAQRVFSFGPLGSVGSGLTLEQFTWQASFLMPGQGGPGGRVHVSIQPAQDGASGRPLVVLEITARCPLGGTLGAPVSEALDRGRAAVVSTFMSVTSTEAQQIWGRDDS